MNEDAGSYGEYLAKVRAQEATDRARFSGEEETPLQVVRERTWRFEDHSSWRAELEERKLREWEAMRERERRDFQLDAGRGIVGVSIHFAREHHDARIWRGPAGEFHLQTDHVAGRCMNPEACSKPLDAELVSEAMQRMASIFQPILDQVGQAVRTVAASFAAMIVDEAASPPAPSTAKGSGLRELRRTVERRGHGRQWWIR